MPEQDPDEVGGMGEHPGSVAGGARPEEGVDRGSASPEPAEERAAPAAEYDEDLVEGATPRLDATDIGDAGAPASGLGNPREGEGSERR